VSVEGANLRFYRLDTGLTLREVSERTGVSISHLSDIERGQSNITVETLKRIGKGLDVSPADLLGVVPQVKWEVCPTCDGRGMVRHPHGAAQTDGCEVS
jgi:transcriptional regulator with XRE-family HTH domain